MPYRIKIQPLRGFTLVELSIVLVIIGLIVGGVLVGRELIYASKLRSSISQLEKYTSAAMAFRDKYNCIPGDCNQAVAFGLGTNGGPGDNGNGDGQVYSDGYVFQSNRSTESQNFWYHLQKANMVAGTFSGWTGNNTLEPSSLYYPQLAIDGPVYVYAYTIGDPHGFGDLVMGNSFYMATTSSGGFNRAMLALDAKAIDTKLDDGKAFSGRMVNNYPYSGPRAKNYNVCTSASGGTMDEDFTCTTPSDPCKCIMSIGKAF